MTCKDCKFFIQGEGRGGSCEKKPYRADKSGRLILLDGVKIKRYVSWGYPACKLFESSDIGGVQPTGKANVLRNWLVLTRSDGVYVLEGEIYNDAKGRFKDGARVTTSRFLAINFMTHIAVTQNTEYYLGERREG